MEHLRVDEIDMMEGASRPTHKITQHLRVDEIDPTESSASSDESSEDSMVNTTIEAGLSTRALDIESESLTDEEDTDWLDGGGGAGEKDERFDGMVAKASGNQIGFSYSDEGGNAAFGAADDLDDDDDVDASEEETDFLDEVDTEAQMSKSGKSSTSGSSTGSMSQSSKKYVCILYVYCPILLSPIACRLKQFFCALRFLQIRF